MTHRIGHRCWSVQLLLMSCCGADGCALLNEEHSLRFILSDDREWTTAV